MMNWINNNKLVLAGVLLGAIAGFVYWKTVGCNTGTCLITSKWHNSTAYGAMMGGLFFSIFKKSPVPRIEKKEKENE
jgi:uncharacterized membrane-anchored protein YjiN (DUF445 family)